MHICIVYRAICNTFPARGHAMIVDRRHVMLTGLAATASLLVTQSLAVAAPRYKAMAFDAFPIFDPRPIGILAETLFPGKGVELINLWRIRQFEYTWLRTVANAYVDFMRVTEDGLVYATKSLQLELLDGHREQLLNAYLSLKAWPDVGPAFARLHKRFLMAPCSNGNIALMADVGRRNNLPWDAILGSEIAQGYKPQPKVYLTTCEAFNLKPEQVMMCAAHSGDLSSAQKLGLRTGHIGRPGEGGPGTGEAEPKGSFDVVGKNFHDFADKLGV